MIGATLRLNQPGLIQRRSPARVKPPSMKA